MRRFAFVIFPLCSLAMAIFFSISSCSGFSYNRYQTAEAMGKGKMKLMAAASAGKNIDEELTKEIKDDMIREAGYEDQSSYVGGPRGRVTGGGSPDMHTVLEILYAAGVHDKIDVQASASMPEAPENTLLKCYFRANAKYQFLTLGKKGAVSVAPGVGYGYFYRKDRLVSTGYQPMGVEGSADYRDTFQGGLWTMEAPLIVGVHTDHFSYYGGFLFDYHFIDLALTRETYLNKARIYQNRIAGYDSEIVFGLYVGVQIRVWHILMTPEYIFTSEGKCPGFALGASW